MTYYLYHIPGKKIGVTCDLNNRVTVQQGYNPDEYEILESSEDIDHISSLELQLQKEYGYRVDMVPYKNLKPKTKMNINVTEQTTTFPCPIDKLKGRLFDLVGMTWTTEHGDFEINPESIKWIMKNVKTSMYNNDRCYIYNKAFAKWFESPIEKMTDPIRENVFDNIRAWAQDRGLYDEGNANTQYIKLQEEAGELAKALLENDKNEIIDAIGDMVVVLTNLAHMHGWKIERCIDIAYDVIRKRTGKMINGTFVKDER